MPFVDSTKPQRVAACAPCRKLKMRCVWTQSAAPGPCDRCLHNGRSCVVPQAQKTGRKQGSKGRYQGVDKALQNLQLALRKAEGQTQLGTSQLVDPMVTTPNYAFLPVSQESSKGPLSPQTSLTTESPSNSSHWTAASRSRAIEPPFSMKSDGAENVQEVPSPVQVQFNQRNIESNPLWLIADASREALRVMTTRTQSPPSTVQDLRPEDVEYSLESSLKQSRHLLSASACVPLGLNLNARTLEEGLDALLATSQSRSPALEYFKYRDVSRFADTGPDLDPVEQGLVTIHEAQMFFPIYFQRVNPITCVLDQKLHTVEFVRSRSALLFTWILAITAQFEPQHSTLATRLRLHGERLCKHVYDHGLKSTEIVQGYYIYLHTATPAPSYGEDRVWLYTAYAFGVASILYLDEPCRRMKRGVDPPSLADFELLSRNRERTWLRILAWEQANNALGNRVNHFPDNDLLRNIETWWRHPMATSTDRFTCAVITLRQRMVTLHSDLRRKADVQDPDPHWIKHTVDHSLAFWHHCWMPSEGPATQPEIILNAYLRHTYMHARLWALSSGLNTLLGARVPTKAVVQDCFHCAVECCEMIVQDLQQTDESLYFMMNSIWAMVCYAAVLALKLFPSLYGDEAGADTQLIALLSLVALHLERAGNMPAPRYGLAALLGQHLKMILQTRSSSLRASLRQLPLQTKKHQLTRSRSTESGEDQEEASSVGRDVLSNDIDALDFDPSLTAQIFTGEDNLWQDDFGDFLQDLFGQNLGH